MRRPEFSIWRSGCFYPAKSRKPRRLALLQLYQAAAGPIVRLLVHGLLSPSCGRRQKDNCQK